MKYDINERNFPVQIPNSEIHTDNMGYHIMWLFNNGYKEAAFQEMLDLLDNYIKEVVRSCASNYPVTFSDYEDLYHEACEVVMIQMQYYDPSITKPNTYFTQYIKARCYDFLRKRYEHTTPYYSKVAAKIRKAIQECKQKNVDYNENKLASITGLSVQTINKALAKMQNAIECSLEDMDFSDCPYMDTPESRILKNEETRILIDTLDYLDDMEKEILFLKAFHAGKNDHSITYKEISNITGYPVDIVKKTLNRAKLKLSRSQELKESFPSRYYDKRNHIRKKNIIIIPEESAEIIEQQLIDSLIDENMDE